MRRFRQYWFVTRPKRKLVLVPDALRAFLAVAEGEVWRGNRGLHLLYEEALETYGIKKVGERRDQQAGGGRTYAAWLYAFGLWFEDSQRRVRPTLAGDGLRRGDPPVPILTKQLLEFQFPSPYSVLPAVNLDPSFRIFPYRFIIRLLLDNRVGQLTKDEIAICVITLAKTERDFEPVVEAIQTYRNLGSDERNVSVILGADYERQYALLDRLREVANTLMNQVEYTQLVDRADGDQPLCVRSQRKHDAVNLLAGRAAIRTTHGRPEVFQRAFGLDLKRRRDQRDFTGVSPVTAGDAQAKKVVWTYYDTIANAPLASLSASLFDQIAETTGIPGKRVERIIRALGVEPSYERFEERYLALAHGGEESAEAFEKATAGIMGRDGLGFATLWVGRKPLNPDVLAIAYGDDCYLGIIDAKAYSDYGLPNDHRNRMVVNYIPNYQTFSYEDKEYQLAFFAYVAGGFSSGVVKGILDIANRSSVDGTCLTAQLLIELVRRHRVNPIPRADLRTLFRKNKELEPADLSTG